MNNTENLYKFSKVFDKENPKKVNPRYLINRICDMTPSKISGYYGFTGSSLSVHASCATGLFAIDYAQKISNDYEYVVVGCSDHNIFYENVKSFSLIGALGNYNCPFDDKRNGFMISEGSGCIIIQSEEKVKKYNSKVYAKLYPSGSSSDTFDLTSPSPDGLGAKISIEKALSNAKLLSEEPLVIDAVSAHATSTIIGDPIEYNAIINKLDSVPIYAPKSKIGHALGSAGILETIYAIESMRNDIIPHCQNLNTCSFDRLNCLVKTPIKYKNKLKRTLNNSFAFGGKCISQVIEV